MKGRDRMDCWQDAVEACTMCVNQKGNKHVVNEIEVSGAKPSPMRVPRVKDQALEGERPDVLIIGGGISGVSIARELTT